LHTLAETVYGFAAALVWLKCTFHAFIFSLVPEMGPEKQAGFHLHHRITTPGSL
jgi:hypothetical protein